jgi:hypothetical protein
VTAAGPPHEAAGEGAGRDRAAEPRPASGEREALDAAAARLERVAAALESAPVEELAALAEEAVALSGEIAERLPRVLRESEPGPEGR